MEKDLLLDKPLVEIRSILWTNIGQSITGMWKSIQIIHEQIDLVAASQEEMKKARDALGNMPEQANKIVYFMNTHTKEDLAKLDIKDKTSTILIIKRVLTMRNFIQNLERKCEEMQMEINAFT